MEIDKTNIDGELYGDEEIWDYIPEVDYESSVIDYDENPEKLGQVDWVNGKPVLSFSSLCDKTKSIFSAVKGVDIQVTEQDGENYIFQANEGGNKPKFIINIPKKPVAGLTMN